MKPILFLLAVCCLLAGCTSPAEKIPAPETVSETIAQTETALITPLPVAVDLPHLENCTIAVSLERNGILTDESGTRQMRVTVFVYDLYDMADIASLQTGSRILLRGEDVLVESLETNAYGTVLINGGLDAGGYELITQEDTVYYETGYSDMKSWYPLGEAVIPVTSDFLYTDSTNPDADPVTGGMELLLSEELRYPFTPQETLLIIDDGKASALYRRYTP